MKTECCVCTVEPVERVERGAKPPGGYPATPLFQIKEPACCKADCSVPSASKRVMGAGHAQKVFYHSLLFGAKHIPDFGKKSVGANGLLKHLITLGWDAVLVQGSETITSDEKYFCRWPL